MEQAEAKIANIRSTNQQFLEYIQDVYNDPDPEPFCPFSGGYCNQAYNMVHCSSCPDAVAAYGRKVLQTFDPKYGVSKIRIDPEDIVGQVFGSLKVEGYTGPGYVKPEHVLRHFYTCRCLKCGTILGGVFRQNLLSGRGQTCGCSKQKQT